MRPLGALIFKGVIDKLRVFILYIHIPRGNFGTMIFLYLMVCSFQKKMIAKPCWGFKELWAFKIRYHLKTKNAIFCIFNTKTSMYQVI